jgi:aquaporin Z
MPPVRSLTDSSTFEEAIALHWPEYLMEAIELGLFMLAACAFGTLLFYAYSPVARAIPSSAPRLVLMGLAMGATAGMIIRSPMGRRSGAHFNPAVSVTFFCLGKMHRFDALFYVAAQFAGGVAGVLAARVLVGPALATASVRYVVTVPGAYGPAAAFGAEVFMGMLTMSVVLIAANHESLSRWTWLIFGFLVMSYVIAFSAVSGFSLNPARTLASAIFANVWTAMWLYFLAPLLGMATSAAAYVIAAGKRSIYCAKIYHDCTSPCPFQCRFSELLDRGRKC